MPGFYPSFLLELQLMRLSSFYLSVFYDYIFIMTLYWFVFETGSHSVAEAAVQLHNVIPLQPLPLGLK